MSRFRWIAVLSILVAAALAMMTCATTYVEPEEAAPAPTEAPAEEEAAPAPTEAPAEEEAAPEPTEPIDGYTLTFGQWGRTSPYNFCTMGPTTGTEQIWLRRLASATLLTLGPDLQWEFELAEAYEISDDAMTILFNLRQDVTWHDGQPFTAGDVVFTFELMLDPSIGAYYAVFYDVVGGVEALDDYTVRFDLLRPLDPGDFGAKSAWRSLVDGWNPVPAHLLYGTPPEEICDTEWAQSNYVGLGPFRVGEFVPDEYVLYLPYRGYFRPTSELDKLTIFFSEEPDALFAALEAGDLDLAQITPEFIDLVDQSTNLYLPENTSLLAVNTDRTDWPLADEYLLRAFLEPEGETFVPYRESISEISEIIGDAVLLPQHPETSVAIDDLRDLLGSTKVNRARTVTLEGNPESVHLAPLGPERAPADPDQFWFEVQERGGFVIGTFVVERDEPSDGGRAQPFAVRVNGWEDSPEIQFVRPDGEIEIAFTEDVTVEVLGESVDIPTARIDRGSKWCSTRWDGIRVWYPCGWW